MRIGLRLLLSFFLIVGVALYVVLSVFMQEVKPGTRQAMEDSLIDAANALALLAAPDVLAEQTQAGQMQSGRFATALANFSTQNPQAKIWGFDKDSMGYRITVTDAHGKVLFDSKGRDVGADYSQWRDVALTLRGQYGARSTLADYSNPDSSVMHVAAPVKDGDRIIGVLTVSRPNQLLMPYIERSQQRILRWSWALLGLSLLIGALCSWWIAASISRLKAYAQAVTRGDRPSVPTFGRFSGQTEFGDLADAVHIMRERLEDKSYVENYVHTLTHELKSPLSAMHGAAQLLQEDLPAADRQRFAANIERQTTRLRDLIDQLLALAHVERISHLKDPQVIDLKEITEHILTQLEPRLHTQGLHVDMTLDLPSSAQATVLADRFLLHQALANLLDNAIDFTPEGGTLSIRIGQADGHWQWQLQDSGPGIPDYALPRVFERFYSLPRTAGGDKSSGLGLSLVQEVAQLHKGSVSIHNATPQGCVVTLSLPMRENRL